MNRVWTEAEREYIRLNSGKVYDEVLAQELSKMVGRRVSVQALRKMRRRMGIKKMHGRGRCEVSTEKK